MNISIFTGKIKTIYNINKMQYQNICLFGGWDDFFRDKQVCLMLPLEMLQINDERISESLSMQTMKMMFQCTHTGINNFSFQGTGLFFLSVSYIDV